MSPGGAGTTTGGLWERTIAPALDLHYAGRYERHVPVGAHLFGGRYFVDFLIEDSILVSAKWQQVPGTAEQKLLYEIATLIDTLRLSQGRYRRAYVVLGGMGFRPSTKNFLFEQRHRGLLQDGHLVEVVSLEEFIGRANRKLL